jgi:hypothetical protein
LSYTWLTFAQAKAQLAARLADPNAVQWTATECGLYIQEALRMWNCYTLTWKADFTFNSGATNWTNLATIANSPRLRTVTDTQCYTYMEYQLSEPPTGATWTGTSQFTISDLAGALQRRRDEIIQVTNCNCSLATYAGTPNTKRTQLSDSTLEPQRVRWLGVDPATQAALPPVTLYRDDSLAIQFYAPGDSTAPSSIPHAWTVSAVPPLAFDVDVAPVNAGNYEVLSLQAGAAFSPPTATLLNIPDDFAWLARMGALADLLGRESEATDRARAEWCQSRYKAGLTVLAKTPWIILATIDNVTIDVPAMTDMDRYAPEWDSTAGFAAVVIAGTDLIWVPLNAGINLKLLGNAPIPSADTDYIQCSRANWDAVLSMAQFQAEFKLGGAEFAASADLEKTFMDAAAVENKQLADLSPMSDILDLRARAENRAQQRD